MNWIGSTVTIDTQISSLEDRVEGISHTEQKYREDKNTVSKYRTRSPKMKILRVTEKEKRTHGKAIIK